MEPMPPALAAGFFTTEPPGKPSENVLICIYFLFSTRIFLFHMTLDVFFLDKHLSFTFPFAGF